MPLTSFCHAVANRMARGNEPAEGLWAAARLGLTEKLKAALDQASCDVVNSKDETGEHAATSPSPLVQTGSLLAASLARHCIVSIPARFVAAHLSPDILRGARRLRVSSRHPPPDTGHTALHHAASCGYEDCVELLLERGADGTSQDEAGNTPLHLAAQVCAEVVG